MTTTPLKTDAIRSTAGRSSQRLATDYAAFRARGLRFVREPSPRARLVGGAGTMAAVLAALLYTGFQDRPAA